MSTTPYEMQSGITSLDPSQTLPFNDIPVKVLKECKDLISPFLSDIYNKLVTLSNFPNSRKMAVVTPPYKKDGTIDKIIIDQSASYQAYLRFLEDIFTAYM